MAQLNIKQIKEAQTLKGFVDLMDFNKTTIEYSLSKQLIEDVKIINSKYQGILMNKIKPLLEIKGIKAGDDDINKFLGKLDIAELLKAQEEVALEYNCAEEFFYILPEAPSKEEFKEFFNKNCGDLADNVYYQFLNDVFAEFNQLIKASGLSVTPRG